MSKIIKVSPRRFVGRPLLVIPDVHAEYVDRKAWNCMMQYAQDIKPCGYVQIGDFLDLNCLSSHNKGKPKLVEGERLQWCYDEGNKLLDELDEVIDSAHVTRSLESSDKRPYKAILKGNHEGRVDRYIEAHPELEGILDVPTGLRLRDRGVEWIDNYSLGHVLKIGKAGFIHGKYTSKYHAQKHVDMYGINVFYGHLHSIQSHSKALLGRDNAVTGQCLGFLGTYDMPYLNGSPTNWQHAFTTFYFRKDGFFNYYIHEIHGGKFIAPNGKTYRG